MISATRVSYRYGTRAVVDEVTLSTLSGRVLGIIGPNGSGKTTLLRMLHGSLSPSSGEVRLIPDAPAPASERGSEGGTPLTRMSPRRIAEQVAVVVQESETHPAATVAETVLLGRTARLAAFARSSSEDHAVALAALERVGAVELARRSLGALSGGERQRVLIARALAQQTDHLLLDEPTNHLDIKYQHEVLALVKSLEQTTVVVLHDLNLAAAYCDELVLLDRGRVVEAGAPDVVLRPDLIERVYGIGTRRLDFDGRMQLAFAPLPATSEAQRASE